MSKRALFIGRFQPPHLAHEWLVRNKLDKGIPCLIAIRDVEPDEKNPLSAKVVAELWKKAFEGEDVKVIIIPDIESINWGRGVGYETNEFEPPPNIYNISATQIRKEINEGIDDWKEKVNPKIHHALKIYLEANLKTYRFYKEEKTWFADIPEWLGSKEELMMVSGADTMLDVLSERGTEIELDMSTKEFPDSMRLQLLRLGEEGIGGGYYRMFKGENEILAEMWLCDVTKFVFNSPMPNTIFIRKHQEI